MNHLNETRKYTMARLNTFILKSGAVVHCERFVSGPKHSTGYWWRNEYANRYVEVVAPQAESDTLFGYPVAEFMAKQYRCTKNY
jgi:hypothetical protein